MNKTENPWDTDLTSQFDHRVLNGANPQSLIDAYSHHARNAAESSVVDLRKSLSGKISELEQVREDKAALVAKKEAITGQKFDELMAENKDRSSQLENEVSTIIGQIKSLDSVIKNLQILGNKCSNIVDPDGLGKQKIKTIVSTAIGFGAELGFNASTVEHLLQSSTDIILYLGAGCISAAVSMAAISSAYFAAELNYCKADENRKNIILSTVSAVAGFGIIGVSTYARIDEPYALLTGGLVGAVNILVGFSNYRYHVMSKAAKTRKKLRIHEKEKASLEHSMQTFEKELDLIRSSAQRDAEAHYDTLHEQVNSKIRRSKTEIKKMRTTIRLKLTLEYRRLLTQIHLFKTRI